MEEKNNAANFGLFVSQRIIVGILLIIAVILILFTVLKFFDKTLETKMTDPHDTDTTATSDTFHASTPQNTEMAAKNTHAAKSGTAAHSETDSSPYSEKTVALTQTDSNSATATHLGDTLPHQDPSPTHAVDNTAPPVHATTKAPVTTEETGHVTAEKTDHAASEETGTATPPETGHATAEKTAHGTPVEGNGHGDGHGLGFPVSDIAGVTFVRAAITPLNHELNERFWGWRPNDVTNVTDNIKNFQLGVLEVTRRTAVVLSERLSRTGITAALDDNLENATNWLMIKPNRYIFPSAEAKYNDSLDAIRLYLEGLENKTARFYTRSDNLLPLLSSYVELLGSCDENLAKMTEEDGSPVSYFKADDYFYYAQGVATSLHTILQAIAHDFSEIIESRIGSEPMHHAIVSCHHAMQIDPVVVLESGLNSIFANHRANMAAQISHAGFYLRVLITTLST